MIFIIFNLLIACLFSRIKGLAIHGQPLLDEFNELKCVWKQFVFAAIFVRRDLGEGYPLGVCYFLSVLHVHFLVRWVRSQDADDVEVGSSVLMVHLFTHRQNSLELTLDPSFLNDFSFDTLLDCLASVNVASRKLPWFGCTLANTSPLLNHEHLVLVVDHDASDSDIMISVCWQSIGHCFVHPLAHQYIIFLFMRMMKIEAVIGSAIHQMAMWWLEEYLDRASALAFPVLQAGTKLDIEFCFCRS